MSERKLLSYILITAFLGTGISLGFYLYFVGNPFERFWPTTQTDTPTSIPTSALSPTPTESAAGGSTIVESDLLQRPADIVGVMEKIDGRTLTVRTMKVSTPYFVPEQTKIYQIRTDILSDPPLANEISLEQIKVESKVSIYFNEDESIRAVFVIK